MALKNKSEYVCQHAGVTLMELMLALAIGSVVVAATVKVFRSQQKAMVATNDRLENIEIRNQILNQTDCQRTLDPYRDADGQVPVDTPVILKGKTRDLVQSAAGATGPFTGSWHFRDNWFLRSVWDGRSIVVNIAKKARSGWVLQAPRPGGFSYGFDSFRNPLMGGALSPYHLCQSSTTSVFHLVRFLPTVATLKAMYGFDLQSCQKVMFEWPLAAISLCSRYCRDQGYASGWWSQCKGFDYIRDANGVVISMYLLNPQDNEVGCACAS